jgi:hypothetical protein
MNHIILALVAAGAVSLSACEKAPAPAAPTTTAVETVTAKQEVKKVWELANITTLSDAQKLQLERAQEAQKGLGTELVQKLVAVSTEKGFPAAVEVCNTDAPAIAARIATEKNVKIGRTSDKLRNPSNTAPEWFTTLVDNKTAAPAVFSGPNGELGWAAPIKLGEMCVNCHGAPESLAPEVATALKEKYPEDKATGYAAGDLRGWFWVEVPST